MSLHCGPRWPAFLGRKHTTSGRAEKPRTRLHFPLGPGLHTYLPDCAAGPAERLLLDYRQRGRSAGVSASVGTRTSRFPPSTASGIEEGVGSRTTSQHSRLSFDPGGLTAAGARDRAVLASPSRCCGCGAQSQCAQGHPPRFTSQRPGHARGAGLLLERSGAQAAFLPPLC